MARKATTALVVLIVLLGIAGPVPAGGGRLAPVRERYEPGQVATLVGYTGGPTLGEIPEEPFYAYLRTVGDAPWGRIVDTDLYVGELALEETAHGGYLQLRVSLTFEVPEDLPAGDYEVIYCDEPCTGRLLGDLIDGEVSIGVDPGRRVVRDWALDDPEIANLAPEALLVGPDFQVTAAELRAGRAVAPPQLPPPAVPPAGPSAEPPALPALPALPAPAPGPDDMAWPLPTALVLAASAGTALLLSRRRHAAGTVSARRAATVERSPGAASAGRG